MMPLHLRVPGRSGQAVFYSRTDEPSQAWHMQLDARCTGTQGQYKGHSKLAGPVLPACTFLAVAFYTRKLQSDSVICLYA